MYEKHFRIVPSFICFFTAGYIYIVLVSHLYQQYCIESSEVISRQKNKVAMVFKILWTGEIESEVRLFFFHHYWERNKNLAKAQLWYLKNDEMHGKKKELQGKIRKQRTVAL